jgi:lipopolysaccharide transport system permease protein
LQVAGEKSGRGIDEQTASLVVAAPMHNLEKVSIEPPKRWVSINYAELWEAREVLYYLALRDLKVRYKQTALGAAWILLQPLAAVVVYSLVFGRVAKLPSEGLPYPLFILTALIPWNLFATGVSRGAESLVASGPLLKKVYLPRLILPLARILGGLIDFFLAFFLLIIMIAWYHVRPTVHVLYLPFFLSLAVIAATGTAFWLSALNVRMRDIQQAVPFLVQLWFFVSPIAYSSSIVNPRWRLIYGLNPMAGIAEGFRWALLGTKSLPLSLVAMSSATSILLLVTGAFFFRKMEQTFADIV